MEMMGKIRRMYFRDQLSLHEITKRTGLSRNTIRKWIRAPEATQPVYQRCAVFNKLSPFHATLEQALKADALRPKSQRRTAKALLAQIRADGYDGGYSQLTAFIRTWRGQQGMSLRAFVPLSFALGEAFQFDWSEEGLLIGGIYRRMQVAHLKLCASRAFWLVAYPSQGHEMLFDAHTRAFSALGGVPRRGIYDNMKTAVDRVNKGKGRTVNARFAVMCAHYLFDPDFCNVASGWEKGIVEKNVQDSRRRIWLEAQDERFSSFEALNAWLSQRCRALWHELVHPQYPGLSVAEVLELEQAEMMPMPAPFDGYVEKPVRVSSTALVSLGRNRYSVPCEFAGRWVSSRLYPTRVELVADDAVIASHARLLDRDQVSYDWQHYLPLIERKPGALRNGAPFADLPRPLRQLRHGLARHAGGDRIMSQVLAAVPVAGLEAVLVAVELVLESGALSAEHILNVVARLTAAPPPVTVENHLPLKEAPLANPARYDRLRAAKERGHA
ncbi:TPA: IS21 family transposase [Pseudomonas aeruginosa]|nr:IS21 family transposase [Pseudomonas aeruginosa]HCE9880132.1 IS21 family transposase [Pseudomonas aeruginosa]HCF0686203.1 IS21 family transposase [Pseudomonas aeruginosa]HCF1202661.1 IS21 family transposase [Pseudomonas aeruginosa]